jgi:hypothetical protein
MEANKNFQHKSVLPVVLTLTGILMGLLLALLAVWADYESTAYGFMRRAQASFQGLTCPVFIGKHESKVVFIKISNPTDRRLSPSIRTQVSAPFEIDSRIEHVELAPGEQITLQRTVGPENIDLGMFIFVDALVYATYPIPDRETTCGILVLPIANGTHLLIFGTGFSILLMGVGMYISYKNEQPGRQSYSTRFIVLATVLAMTFGFWGWWVVALILIILSILTLLISAGNSLTLQTER